MACGDNDKLVCRWIMEYHCWRLWTQFAQLGSVDSIQDRTCPTYPENLDDRKTDGCRLLVLFMCKICEATNELCDTAAERDVTPRQTNLEAAIDLLDPIYKCFTSVLESGELNDVQLCLKRHAVLMPLRKNDRITAKAIFDRQWRHWKNADEMKCKNKLARMIDNDASPLKQLPSFSEVIVKCQTLLEKIMSSLDRPFLVEVAQQVCEKVQSSNANMQSSTSALQQSSVKSVLQTSPVKSPGKKTCVIRVDKLSEQDVLKTSAVKSPAKQTRQSAAAADTASDRSKPADSVSHSESTVRPSTSSSVNNKPDEVSYESDTDSIDMDDDDWWQPSSKHRKKAGTKKPWSVLEEELVYKGVKAHGVGSWAQIHAKFLQYRSNIDIKDKWRTMIRQGRVRELADQFGPLPLS